MKIKIAIVFLVFVVLVFMANSFARSPIGNSGGSYPAVELWHPVTEDIDLTKKDSLQFKWRQIDLSRADHYVFKLYKGYDMVESNLILKKEVGQDEYPFELPADNFEVNQIYTWSLRQIYLSGAKSDLAFSPFKIIKK